MPKKGKKSIVLAVVFLVVAAILAGSIYFSDRIDAALGLGGGSEQAVPGESERLEDLNVHFIDVGQGDSCIVELPDDRTILIDGANNGYDDEIIAYIEENIHTNEGDVISFFDFAILTHTDSDHCASMDEVLTRFPAKTFYRPNVLCDASGYDDPGRDDLYGNYTSKSTIAYRNVLEAAYAYDGVEVLVNSWDLDPIVPVGLAPTDPGYYSLEFYGPIGDAYKDWNNYSPIMVLEYAGKRFLLTGDCEKEGEAEFVERARTGEGKYSVFDENFTVDVIKLGHHGSRTSTGKDLVEVMTTPDAVDDILLIVSCGQGNSYGHPHPDKLAELIETGFLEENILRTDTMGDIAVSVRYDEASGSMQLFHGENAIVRDDPGRASPALSWKYIAIAAIIVLFVILIALTAPNLLRPKGRKRR